MLNLQYIGDSNNYSVSFSNINKNVVEVIGADLPKQETGFILTRIGDPHAFKGDYSDFKTVYREIEGGFQYSNDGSTYAPEMPFVCFETDGGGVLVGETMQQAERYEELKIPTAEASENHVFKGWMPEIPENGEIDGNKSFNAIFESTIPDPGQDETIADRVAALENDVKSINAALGG